METLTHEDFVMSTVYNICASGKTSLDGRASAVLALAGALLPDMCFLSLLCLEESLDFCKASQKITVQRLFTT